MNTTIIKDKGYTEAINKINSLNNCFVKVGYPSGEAETSKIHGKTKFSMVQLATVHEFGAKIKHPGGTLFSKNKKGQVRFTKQGGKVKVAGEVDKNRTVMGITGEHAINIPERSFIRKSFDKDRNDIQKFVGHVYGIIVDNKYTIHQGLSAIGQFAVNSIKKYFPSISPPLSKKTIVKKKSSKPLINTGIMRNSMTFEINKGV
jgi:hypothetical protein